MLVAICGESGAGKTELQKELGRMGFNEIVTCTTRAPRAGERDGVDYHFISQQEFERRIKDGEFAEWEEYSQSRFYGTMIADARHAALSNERYAIVVTPNGVRSLEKTVGRDKLVEVMVTASLGVRVKRYIDRCGADNFNFDDMNEINARVNRDFGMFLNMDRNVDLVLDNSLDARYDPKGFGVITKMAEQVESLVKRKEQERFSFDQQPTSEYETEWGRED